MRFRRRPPRSYRMMQGFGVYTFRLVNADGHSVFCKFHWKPLLGTHSLVWDEAVKIMGADPDFHRRDPWEAIESGNDPEWELGVQIFTENDAEGYSFDVLDATKLVPEELVPVQPIGRMVLNRNPDNYLAETEQVAFCTAHVVPGIDFSNDPLLHGRHHSYLDTQISRLGGGNFHEIPINASLAPVHNNQRDGLHRRAIPRGRVAYEPNSPGGGCPFQAGRSGFVSFPKAIEPDNAPVDKVRGKPEKFAEHYNQARLFFASQTPVEKAHLIAGFCFELSKVSIPAIRQRMVAGLRNVSDELAAPIATALGLTLPDAMPLALARPPRSEIESAPSLSLRALPGQQGIATRKVAIVIADGVAGASINAVVQALNRAGAVDALSKNGHTLEFLKDQYRHCKSIVVLGASSKLLKKAGIFEALPSGETDPGLLLAQADNYQRQGDRAGVKSNARLSGRLNWHTGFFQPPGLPDASSPTAPPQSQDIDRADATRRGAIGHPTVNHRCSRRSTGQGTDQRAARV